MKARASDDRLIRHFAFTERLKVRADADGTLIVPGKFGHIYEYDHHSLAMMVLPVPPRKNYWGITRTKLVKLGLTLVQDGDREGAAVFDSSNRDQADAAIRAAAIFRKRRVSPAQVNRQITWLRAVAGRAL